MSSSCFFSSSCIVSSCCFIFLTARIKQKFFAIPRMKLIHPGPRRRNDTKPKVIRHNYILRKILVSPRLIDPCEKKSKFPNSPPRSVFISSNRIWIRANKYGVNQRFNKLRNFSREIDVQARPAGITSEFIKLQFSGMGIKNKKRTELTQQQRGRTEGGGIFTAIYSKLFVLSKRPSFSVRIFLAHRVYVLEVQP